MADSASLLADSEVDGRPRGIKDRLKIFLDNPNSSNKAMLFYTFICVGIVASSVLMIVETLPEYYGRRRTKWFNVDLGIVCILSVDFTAKLFANTTTVRSLVKWIFSWSFLTESLSVVPFWIDLAVGGRAYNEVQRLTVFRLFRLLRLAQILSGSSHLQSTMDSLYLAVYQCMDVLMSLFLLQFVTATVFATILYFAERGEWNGETWLINGQPSKFNSIPACYWYVYTVMSTVGLGDMSPQTAIGKLLTWPLMLLTIVLLTFPSVIIANHFTQASMMTRTGSF